MKECSMRILVPVDGSIPSRSVLQFVSDRAKQMPVMPVVQLLTVEPPVPSSGLGTMMELEGYVEQGSGKHFSLTVTLLEE